MDILPIWPLWPDFIEKELELTHDELSVYMDKQFGNDERFLQKTRVAPCLLQALGECHTYPMERDSSSWASVSTSTSWRPF
jgi:hypothetical protein